jgi:hypothetical protein
MTLFAAWLKEGVCSASTYSGRRTICPDPGSSPHRPTSKWDRAKQKTLSEVGATPNLLSFNQGPPYKDPTPPSGTVTPPRTHQLGQTDRSRLDRHVLSRIWGGSSVQSDTDQVFLAVGIRLGPTCVVESSHLDPGVGASTWSRTICSPISYAAMPDPRLSGPNPSALAARIAW